MSRRAWIAAGLAAAGLVLGVLALSWGDYPISWPQLFEASESGDFARTVVFTWRAPRITAALAFGAALGIAGMVFQTITANPLGSPDIVGFATGSYTGVLLATILLGGGGAALAGGALTGGLATAAVVYGLTHRYGAQAFRLIVVGLAVTAMLHAVNLWILTKLNQEVAVAASIWAGGSLSLISWQKLAWGLPLLALIGGLAPVLLPWLRQLELGDDAAAAHGVRPARARLAAVLLGVGLVAAVTACAGPIAFIALASPQVAARVAKGPGLPLGASAATGAVLLLTSDLLAQFVAPQPLPLGVVTVCLGGIYLMGLLWREARRAA
ncbi:MAG: iron chelate uptake ABC transporter family permease subunit [Bifidobacteriaceae bacterium]|jgi:iron complex transport system permease protein|nr:iron chelate uptake ABC transporter family permease subunit [Bifidobacteriaceae bacterium]